MKTKFSFSTLTARSNAMERRLLPAVMVIAAAAAAGCATVEQTARDLGIDVKKVPVASSTSAQPAAAPPAATPARAQPVAAVNPLQGTELDGIFKKGSVEFQVGRVA